MKLLVFIVFLMLFSGLVIESCSSSTPKKVASSSPSTTNQALGCPTGYERIPSTSNSVTTTQTVNSYGLYSGEESFDLVDSSTATSTSTSTTTVPRYVEDSSNTGTNTSSSSSTSGPILCRPIATNTSTSTSGGITDKERQKKIDAFLQSEDADDCISKKEGVFERDEEKCNDEDYKAISLSKCAPKAIRTDIEILLADSSTTDEEKISLLTALKKYMDNLNNGYLLDQCAESTGDPKYAKVAFFVKIKDIEIKASVEGFEKVELIPSGDTGTDTGTNTSTNTNSLIGN